MITKIRTIGALIALTALNTTAVAQMSQSEKLTCKMPTTGVVQIEWKNFATQVTVTINGQAVSYVDRSNRLTPVSSRIAPSFNSKGYSLERIGSAGGVVEIGRCK